MSDYTPPIEQVRQLYANSMDPAGFDRMIAQERAEALREAYADLEAYTDSGAPFGHRPVEEFLLHRADRIEKEAGL